MRDAFAEDTKRALGARVGQRCSNPTCGALTSGPQADPERALNVGVAAHITAAAPGGVRYDATLTPEQRRHANNGIWLCQTCGKLVDNDATLFPVDTLRAWKQRAENEALSRIGKTAVVAGSTAEDPRFRGTGGGFSPSHKTYDLYNTGAEIHHITITGDSDLQASVDPDLTLAHNAMLRIRVATRNETELGERFVTIYFTKANGDNGSQRFRLPADFSWAVPL